MELSDLRTKYRALSAAKDRAESAHHEDLRRWKEFKGWWDKRSKNLRPLFKRRANSPSKTKIRGFSLFSPRRLQNYRTTPERSAFKQHSPVLFKKVLEFSEDCGRTQEPGSSTVPKKITTSPPKGIRGRMFQFEPLPSTPSKKRYVRIVLCLFVCFTSVL